MSFKTHFKYLYRLLLAGSVLVIIGINRSYGQSSSKKGIGYKIVPQPDLWYNSVDGVRFGVRLKGEVPGTFGDGPHRLNLGIWGGSKFPNDPVSYYMTFTEPIKSLSNFGSEANVQFKSSIRTGYDDHGISFQKRWQIGFDNANYRNIRFSLSAQKLVNTRYRLFPFLWSRDWLTLATVTFQTNNKNGLGKYRYELMFKTGLPVKTDFFEHFTGSFEQSIKIGSGFVFHGRFFTGISSEKVPLQMEFNRSLASPIDWLDNGFSRARGTIPPVWLKEGWLQIAGGPSLRGYTKQDMAEFFAKRKDLNPNFSSLNLEMDYPNPLDKALKKIPVLGDLVSMRSYLFMDSGSALQFSNNPLIEKVEADAGPGFAASISIPDNKGHMRSVVLRYDVPLWLSHPGADNNPFAFRNIVGISTIINL